MHVSVYRSLRILFAIVWLANGLLCKVLDLVPRHQEIVGRILGNEHAFVFTKIIGVSEILMSVWILSGLFKKLNAVSQILIIATMNTIEFLVVPDILLWGRWNSFFALLFISLIYWNEFKLAPKTKKHV